MGNIIDFAELSKRIEEKDIEDKVNFYSVAIAFNTLVAISQEINAVVHFLSGCDFSGNKKMGKAIQQIADVAGMDSALAISELFVTHGNSMANMGEAIKNTVKGAIPTQYAILEAKEAIVHEINKDHTPLISVYRDTFIDILGDSIERDKELLKLIQESAGAPQGADKDHSR